MSSVLKTNKWKGDWQASEDWNLCNYWMHYRTVVSSLRGFFSLHTAEENYLKLSKSLKINYFQKSLKTLVLTVLYSWPGKMSWHQWCLSSIFFFCFLISGAKRICLLQCCFWLRCCYAHVHALLSGFRHTPPGAFFVVRQIIIVSSTCQSGFCIFCKQLLFEPCPLSKILQFHTKWCGNLS